MAGAAIGNYANSMQGPVAGSTAYNDLPSDMKPDAPYYNIPLTSTSQSQGITPMPMVPSAPMQAAQPDFNQLAAQGMKSAMGATRMGMQGSAQGMNFYSPMYAGAYMNPYQQNVIGGLRQEAGRNYDMMSNQIGAEATRAGAFGGSRHGVAQGTAAGDIQRGLNQQVGQLQYQGYGDALNRASQDQQMRMGASSQLTGQAQALSGIGNQMYNMNRQANLDMQQAGLQQQAINQAIIDAGKGQYAGFTGAPALALSYLTQALGGASGMVPQNTTQTNTKDLGLFDYLTLGATVLGK